MRRLLCLVAFIAVSAGCGGGGGSGTSSPHVQPTPAPTITEVSGDLGPFCLNAPTLTLPGTYPAFKALGTLTGTTFVIDPNPEYVLFAYPMVEPPTPSPTPTPTPSVSPSPTPTSSPIDVWTGTVTYSGTPHDATICFVAAAYVDQAVTLIQGQTDNTIIQSVPDFGGADSYIPTTQQLVPDTMENVVLTLSTTSTSSGSFTLAGGGQATIAITTHGIYTEPELRRRIAAAIAAHKLPGPLR
jgi:hypothetical protein